MLKRLLLAQATAIVCGYCYALYASGGMTLVPFPMNFVAIALYVELLSIGFLVTLAGVFTAHPLFGFPMFVVRGAALGALVALVYVLGMSTILYAAGAARPEWVPHILLGAAAGALIDVVATIYAGSGKSLMHPKNK